MAGPWFMVTKHNDDWHTMAQLWLSDGQHDGQGRIEIRVWLDDGTSIESTHNIHHHPMAQIETQITGPIAGAIR